MKFRCSKLQTDISQLFMVPDGSNCSTETFTGNRIYSIDALSFIDYQAERTLMLEVQGLCNPQVDVMSGFLQPLVAFHTTTIAA